MRFSRKIMSCVAASTMALSIGGAATATTLAVSNLSKGIHVFAASNYQVTIHNTASTEHNFDIYQIFTGTTDGSSNSIGDIQWGTGVKDSFKTNKAADIANELSNGSKKASDIVDQLSENKQTVVIGAGESKDLSLASGYYLIIDTAKGSSSTDKAVSYMLKVSKNTVVTPKSDVPASEKKVKEDDHKVDCNTDSRLPNVDVGKQYNDVADYSIGENVPFELLGSLPSNYDSYQTYSYKFYDKMSNGLTFNNDAKVSYSNDNGASWTTIDSAQYTVTKTSDQQFDVSFSDLKKVAGVTANSKIKVEFTAKLNSQAKIGAKEGNTNESYIEYSNNPDHSGTGTTTPDKVIVFTYELDTTKVDKDNPQVKLKNAEFKLADSSKSKWLKIVNDEVTWVASKDDATTLKSDDNGKFVVKGLDSGTYYLQETKAPEGYNLDETMHEVTLKAETVNNQTWDENPSSAITSLTLNGKENTGDTATGIVNATIDNAKGPKLPETGGMGTTMLYAAGGVLVAAATVYVVTSKKKQAEAEK